MRADNHWFSKKDNEKNPHANFLPQYNKPLENTYEYEKNPKRQKIKDRLSSFQENSRLSLRGSNFSEHHSFQEKIFETCPTLASEISPRNSVFNNNKDLNKLKSLVAGSEIYPVMTEENNLGEMQTEDECDGVEEYGSECFDEKEEGNIERKTNFRRDKEKIFTNQAAHFQNDEDKENIPNYNQMKGFHKSKLSNGSIKSNENNKNKEQLSKQKNLNQFGSLHQTPFQVYSKDTYKDNKNLNKDNINKYLRQPFTILAPDTDKGSNKVVVDSNIHNTNVYKANNVSKPNSINNNTGKSINPLMNNYTEGQGINNMRNALKPNISNKKINKSSSKKSREQVEIKANEKIENTPIHNNKIIKEGLHHKIGDLSRSGKYINDHMLDSIRSRESVILEVPEEKPKEDAFLEYLKRNILLKNPNIDNYTRALLETPIKIDASQREKLESCLVVKSVLSGEKMMKFVSENFASNIDEITKKYLQFLEENQVNNQIEQSAKYPDLITSKILQSEEKYDYSYRKPQEKDKSTLTPHQLGNNDNNKLEKENRSYGSSDCDERDFDEKNSGESEEEEEVLEESFDREDLAASNIGGDVDEEYLSSSYDKQAKVQAGKAQGSNKQQNIFSYYKKAELVAEQEKQRILMMDYMEDINEVFEEEDESEDESRAKKKILNEQKMVENDYYYEVDDKSEKVPDEEPEAENDSNEEEEEVYEVEGEDEYEEEEESNNSRDSRGKGGRQLNYEDVVIPNYLKNIVHNKSKSNNGISKSDSTEVIRISLSNTESEEYQSNSEEIDENKDLLFKRPKDRKNIETEFFEQVNFGVKKDADTSIFSDKKYTEAIQNERGPSWPHSGNFDVKRNIVHIKSGSFGNPEMLQQQQVILEQSRKRHSFVHEPDTPNEEEERRITLVESRYMADDDPEKTLFNPKMDLFFAKSGQKSEKKVEKSGLLASSKKKFEYKDPGIELDFHEKISQFLTKIREETPLIRVSQNKLFESSINYESFHKHKARQLFDIQDEINLNKQTPKYKTDSLPQQKIPVTKPITNKLDEFNKADKEAKTKVSNGMSHIKEDNLGKGKNVTRKENVIAELNPKKTVSKTLGDYNKEKSKAPTHNSPLSINGNSSNNTSAINSSLVNTSIANSSSITANNSTSGAANNIQRGKRGNNLLTEIMNGGGSKHNWITRFSTKEGNIGQYDNKGELVRGGSHKVLTSSSQNSMKILNQIKKSNSKSTFENYKTPGLPNAKKTVESREKSPQLLSNKIASNEEKKGPVSQVDRKLKIDQRTKTKWSVPPNHNSIYDDIKKKFDMKDQAISRKHFK